MSEEFGYKARFKCESREAIALLKAVAEKLENREAADIESLLGSSSFELSTKEVEQLTTEPYYGAYKGKLAKALAEVAEPCGATLGVQGQHGLMDLSAMKPDADGIYEIYGEGDDREADDFCSYLTIFLHAIGARSMRATATGAGWVRKWDNTSDQLTNEFKEEEW